MNEKEKNDLIYQQRYETFRHLDKQRWRTIALATTLLGAIAGVIVRSGYGIGLANGNMAVALLGLGITYIGFWYALLRVNQGIDKNNAVLRCAGKKIGDACIPEPDRFGVGKVFSWVCGMLGIIFVAMGIKIVL